MKNVVNYIRTNSYKVEIYTYAAVAVAANIGLLAVLWRVSPNVAGPLM